MVSSIRKDLQEEQRGSFVAVVHRKDELKKLVGFKAADDAYLVVLDRAGKIAYQSHSAVLESGYPELRAKVLALLP